MSALETALVAHELRSPLAAQRALLELALSDPRADVASWREIGADVLDSCLEQERLLEACLSLARSERGLTRREPVELTALADHALHVQDMAGLECVVVLEPACVRGDAELLERLVANLVSNAIRHNVAGGRIELATRVESGRAHLTVANTGPVVSARDLQRLFQPFQRLAPRRADGVGLGLVIVRAIADAHGAAVAATPRAGGGLAIDVTFPR